jgi:hypothetical protein
VLQVQMYIQLVQTRSIPGRYFRRG